MNDPSILVLPDDCDRDRLRAALIGEGMAASNLLQGDGVRLSTEEVWARVDRRVATNIVDDPLLGCSYLAIRGAGAAGCAERLAVSAELIAPSQGLLEAAVDLPERAQIKATYRLAALYPGYAREAFDVLVMRATADPRANVREAAVDAMGYRGWSDFLPLLASIAASDTSAKVRTRAADLLAHLKSHPRDP